MTPEIEKAIASRSCGDCHACCDVGLSVPEISKPADKSCVNLNTTGCKIYDTRPQGCRDFYCMWRQGMGRLMERPDKVGYFLDITPNGVLIAREVWPLAFDSTLVRERLDKLATKRPIFKVRGDKKSFIGPQRLVEEIRKKIKIVDEV